MGDRSQREQFTAYSKTTRRVRCTKFRQDRRQPAAQARTLNRVRPGTRVGLAYFQIFSGMRAPTQRVSVFEKDLLLRSRLLGNREQREFKLAVHAIGSHL
jgi:hypothetical protein